MELSVNSVGELLNKKANILIAEDENIIAKDISKTVSRLGYNVLDIVRNSGDVIKKATDLKPDLILMDIMLDDDSSGISAAEEIAEHFDIPIVYLTALADEETLQRAKITEPYGYVLKPFDAPTLNSSIEMALYKHEINQKLKRRTKQLEEEKIKSNKLLHNILPAEIVKELRDNGIISPRYYKSVTIMITDFEGFTSISSGMHPSTLVKELNEIFKNFDSIIDKYNLEKLKTMGDSYMVAGGLPKEIPDHAEKIVCAALDMQNYLEQRNINSRYKWRMRTGIHTGDVVAGVVGKNKFTYDIWGNTVNIASVMERNSQPGKVNITEATYLLISDNFECELHNKVEITGNGTLDMYFINQKKNETLEIPQERTD